MPYIATFNVFTGLGTDKRDFISMAYFFCGKLDVSFSRWVPA